MHLKGQTCQFLRTHTLTLVAWRALKVSYSDKGEGGIAVNCEKTHFFLNNLYHALLADNETCVRAWINMDHQDDRVE